MSATDYEAKAASYRTFGNGAVARAVLEHLPEGGSLLDVGCASGGLLALARDRAGHLAGLEVSEVAAEAAGEVADVVVRLPLDAPDIPFDDGSFDVVSCADVLEHTIEPGDGLRRAARWVKPGGHVIVSVPNIGHWSARLRVLRGRWEYDDTGIFDSGHLRFFTPATIARQVRDAALEVERVEVVVPALRNAVPALGRAPRSVAARVETAWQGVGRRRPGLFGYQIVVVARRPSAS